MRLSVECQDGNYRFKIRLILQTTLAKIWRRSVQKGIFVKRWLLHL
jgi:hypothetical protein